MTDSGVPSAEINTLKSEQQGGGAHTGFVMNINFTLSMLLARQRRTKLQSARKSSGRILICSKSWKWDLQRGVTMSSSD